ncbi:propanediol utilization protein [Paracoccus sp. (in: a-proteobacteria)]|uniref:propanediol utilization protein n=1 Tax=Paracoccus sp. TaxID=267 RepID=UPI003A83ADF4
MKGCHIPGHFGEWLQGRLGAGGPVVLITMPCACFGVRALHRPARSGFVLRAPGLSAGRAQVFLARLGLRLRGRVDLSPVGAPGLGTGISTVSLLALARLAGWRGPPERLARACIAAEGASDPLMFSSPERLLWASRRGRVMDHMPALPAHEVLGGFCGGPVRTDARDRDFPDIADLVLRWHRARRLVDFAALASESAARCSARRGPAQETPPQLARDLGALGWTRAHTGAARGLIFAPGTIPDNAPQTLREAGWTGLCRFGVNRHEQPSPGLSGYW